MTAEPSATPDTRPLPLQCLIGLLEAQCEWLAGIDPADYRRESSLRLEPIGRHLRHSVEHIQALVGGCCDGCACYDRRPRDQQIETDRDSAIACMRELADRLAELEPQALDADLEIEVILDPAYPAERQKSSLRRELAFVLSHTIHHNVIIGVVAQEFGYQIPKTLMTAPATLAADAS